MDSVLAQTYSDFELIVIDDGSTDGTREALDRLDGRLRYMWQENRGVSAARNAGLRVACGSVIAFLDSDDLWLPDHLKTVSDALASYPQAVLASTWSGYDDEGSTRPEQARLVDPLPDSLIFATTGFVPCVAARREALLAVGGFDERLAAAEDNDLWSRLSLIGPFALLRRRTVVRRRTPGGLRELGLSSGTYLTACAASAARIVEEVERRPDAAKRGLIAPARASLHLAGALDAIARRDPGPARAELAAACRLMPKLENTPQLVTWRITHTASRDADRAESYLMAARLWPRPGSQTDLALRRRALRLAVRSGNLAVTARLAADPVLLLRAIVGARTR